MNLIVPGLLWQDTDDIDYIFKYAKINNLLSLLSKAHISKHNFSYSDIIYQHISKDLQPSLAKQVAQVNNWLGLHSEFLIIQPTHLRVDRDRLLICEPELLQLTKQEEFNIIEAINKHFDNEVKIYWISYNVWLIGLNFTLSHHNQFYPIIDIIGNNINDYFPQGENSILFSKLLNEIQMLLFNLPLNKTRRSESQITINSVWMWDKQLNDISHILGNRILINMHSFNIKEYIDKQIQENQPILMDNLYYPCCYRDSSSFINQLENFDSSIAIFLKQYIRKGLIKKLHIWVPQSTKTIEIAINRFDQYKFWKKNTFQSIIEDLQ